MTTRPAVLFRASTLLMVVMICTASTQGKVESPRLIDLIKYSDCIAEGRVIKISVVRDVRIAELEVARIHKGSLSIKRVHIWASSTWACDISNAEPNESGLYFLTLWERKASNREQPEFAQELDDVLKGEKLYAITWSGYGRLVHQGDGRLRASDYVTFPRTVSVRYVRTGPYSSVALADARDIVWLIHTSRLRKGG